MNISSVIVIPHTDEIDNVRTQLEEMPGVDVAIVSPEGKIVITIETQGDPETIQTYERISLMPGVLSASMVYHQQENEPEVEISSAA